jgi:hypothetical protein
VLFKEKTGIELPDWYNGSECTVVFDDSFNAYLVKHTFNFFNTMPDIVVSIRRALELQARSFKIVKQRHEVPLGRVMTASAANRHSEGAGMPDWLKSHL